MLDGHYFITPRGNNTQKRMSAPRLQSAPLRKATPRNVSRHNPIASSEMKTSRMARGFSFKANSNWIHVLVCWPLIFKWDSTSTIKKPQSDASLLSGPDIIGTQDIRKVFEVLTWNNPSSSLETEKAYYTQIYASSIVTDLCPPLTFANNKLGGAIRVELKRLNMWFQPAWIKVEPNAFLSQVDGWHEDIGSCTNWGLARLFNRLFL